MKKEADDFIKLDSFLKKMNLAETGGQAKIMIQSGQVKVNGETELRRGRKLFKGDEVEISGKKHTVE